MFFSIWSMATLAVLARADVASSRDELAKLAPGLNTENLVKRALFAIATHSNQDELTAAERKFAAAFENAYQASVESNDPTENDPASSNKELERHRRWGWLNKAVKKTTKWVKKAAKKTANFVSGAVKSGINAINRIHGMSGILKAFSKVSGQILDAAGLNFGKDLRDMNDIKNMVMKGMKTRSTWLLRKIKTKIQKKIVKFVAKQLERKVFEKTKAAPVLISMRKAGRTQAKIQKAAYSFFRKLHSKATGSDIEQRMRKHIFRNVDRVIWMLERFVKPARDILNMKPFGITIKQEIHNLQMDLIRQVLKDYKLKGRSRYSYIGRGKVRGRRTDQLNDPAENGPASSDKELARHRRWGWLRLANRYKSYFGKKYIDSPDLSPGSSPLGKMPKMPTTKKTRWGNFPFDTTPSQTTKRTPLGNFSFDTTPSQTTKKTRPNLGPNFWVRGRRSAAKNGF